jgi:ubiquitin carboxyl-terminal hydrolase 8
MDFGRYKDRGLSGLRNLGSTCFINSCIQVLSHTYELHELFEKPDLNLNVKLDSVLIQEFNEIRRIVWSKNCVIVPNKFISTIRKISKGKQGTEFYIPNKHHDVGEFLLFLLDCFHSGLSREVEMKIVGTQENDTDNIAVQCYEMIKANYASDYSEIVDLFYGILVSRIISIATTKVLTMKPETFFPIDLPISGNNNDTFDIYHYLDIYCEGELLQGEEGWLNPATSLKEDVRKQLMFWKLPNILVIALKRFTEKQKKMVDFPLVDFQLSKYVMGYNNYEYVYDLYGVCNHYGNAFHGHYNSFVKNANGSWYLFDDESVSLIDESKIVNPHAYFLFYRKKNITCP